jgi:hypothetical protein
MNRKVLQIVESAYRATIEEQDDTVLWITHAMRGAGAELAVLLCGPATSYAVRAQSSAGIGIGTWRQVNPPQPQQDLGHLVGKGVPVYLLQEDANALGIEPGEMIDGIQSIARSDLPRLLAEFDQVWRW